MELPETMVTASGPMVVGAGPDLLEELLDYYAFVLGSVSPEISDSMLPGLSETQIRDQLGDIGLAPTAEILVWWKWRNGHRPFVAHGLRHAQFKLEDAIAIYKEEPLGTSFDAWNPSWILIAGESNSGDAACCEGDMQPLVRAVSTFDLGTNSEDIRCQVVSICTPVTWWLWAIREGWTKFDHGDGFWHYDSTEWPIEWRITNLI